MYIKKRMFVLSLLKMTNSNQMCEVLLFVCSKMADETNPSSKLPVADSLNQKLQLALFDYLIWGFDPVNSHCAFNIFQKVVFMHGALHR